MSHLLLQEAKRLLSESFYTGPSLEKGGTSIKGQGAAPFVRRMAKGLKKGDKILDYGAGKYARNADYLRSLGFEVYAYDPYNGSGSDGWAMGNVARQLPSGEGFDLGFTSYVLNVVPEPVETKITREVSARCKRTIHITRNLDIFESVKKALLRGDKTVMGFFLGQYVPARPGLDPENLTDEIIMDFCLFGVQTSRGFQRIPMLEKKGFKLLAETKGFKAYSRS